MENITTNIQRVNAKLQKLLKQHLQLLKDFEKQSKLIATLQTIKEQQTQQINQQQQQINILKLSVGKLEGIEKKDFEKQINQYIKEIDKCINVIS